MQIPFNNNDHNRKWSNESWMAQMSTGNLLQEKRIVCFMHWKLLQLNFIVQLCSQMGIIPFIYSLQHRKGMRKGIVENGTLTSQLVRVTRDHSIGCTELWIDIRLCELVWANSYEWNSLWHKHWISQLNQWCHYRKVEKNHHNCKLKMVNWSTSLEIKLEIGFDQKHLHAHTKNVLISFDSYYCHVLFV